MSISFGSNISSLRAQRQLGKQTAELNTVFERLSSGLRINSASDDAAGLAVSSGLDADRRIYSQGLRNLNDGISLLNVADGAVEQLVDIVTRLKELGQQAANGTYGVNQRTALDTEAQALSREYTRITQSTSFNGKDLFSAAFGQLKIQSGFGANGGIQSTLGGSIGTGAFTGPSTFTTEAGAVATSSDAAVADLNGDGILDLVSAGGPSLAQSYATVRLGTGGGTFGSSISYAAQANSALAVALGDLNGDGILDLVTAGVGASGGEISIRFGVGDGTFGSRSSYVGEANGTFDIALADLNRDGNLDLISTGTDTASGLATVRLGAGNGTFGAAASYQMGTGGSSNVKIGDINNDGILDLVTASFGGGSFLMSRLGNGDGTFAASRSVAGSILGEGLALGDLNGDGFLDAFANGSSGPGSGSAEVFFGSGTGTFSSVMTYVGGAGRSANIADVNGDGRLDLVDSSKTAINIRLNTGNGSFAPVYSYTITNSSANGVVLDDLDGDGALDIFTAGTDLTTGQGSVRLQTTTNGLAPLLSFSLKSRADALQAIPKFDQALSRLTVQRGVIGAFQSRIETAVNTLSIATENYRTAVSQITDADVAVEAANLVRTKILQQGAGAVLAQANQQPELALSLLKSPSKK